MQRKNAMGLDQKSLLTRSVDWAGRFLWLYGSAFLGMLALGAAMVTAASWAAYLCLASALMILFRKLGSCVQHAASTRARLLEDSRQAERLLKIHGLPASPSNRLIARCWIEHRREVIATEKAARESALKALEDAGIANPKTRYFDEFERRFGSSMPEKIESGNTDALSEQEEFLRWMQSGSDRNP